MLFITTEFFDKTVKRDASANNTVLLTIDCDDLINCDCIVYTVIILYSYYLTEIIALLI